jgi:RNA polymerase sigma factor (sigma-70 family)
MVELPEDEKLRRLEYAARNMPKLQREILMAHRLEDMPYEEIARRTGLTVRQVERHVARAIYKLAVALDGGKLRWWDRLF